MTSPNYFLPGKYKLFASPWVSDDELRPGLVTIEATLNLPSTIYGQVLTGNYYLGQFKLSTRERYLLLKFNRPVMNYRLVDIDRDDMINFTAGHSNNNIVREIYPDGTVKIRMKEVMKNG